MYDEHMGIPDSGGSVCMVAPDRSACCDDIIHLAGKVEALVQNHTAYVTSMDSWKNRHEADQRETVNRLFDRIDDGFKAMANRPPLWMMLLFSTAMTVIGFLLGIVYFLARAI